MTQKNTEDRLLNHGLLFQIFISQNRGRSQQLGLHTVYGSTATHCDNFTIQHIHIEILHASGGPGKFQILLDWSSLPTRQGKNKAGGSGVIRKVNRNRAQTDRLDLIRTSP